ncbi:hypothetical protein Syn7502_01749 [Synechococcus sp. PCC 7502]|nr:hypothetical protein Syn7502_01749 [Synechococcus sp. PCC 7502]
MGLCIEMKSQYTLSLEIDCILNLKQQDIRLNIYILIV